MHISRLPSLVTILILMVGCVKSGKVMVDALEPVPVSSEQQLFYNILVAEIAGHNGNLSESVRHYQKVLKQQSANLPVIRRATHIMLFAKDYDAANQVLRYWLKLQPNSVEAHQLAAVVGLHRADIALAVKHLDWVVRQSKSLLEGFRLVGALLGRVKNEQTSLAVMREMQRHYPMALHANLLYARLLLSVGEFEEAKNVISIVVRNHPDNIEAQIIFARAKSELGQTDEALNAIKGILREHPGDSELRLNYARMLITARRYERAIEQFMHLIGESGKVLDGGLLYSTALLAMQIHRYSLAEQYLNQLLEMDRYKQQAQYYLGRLYEQRKQYEQSLSWYERVDDPALYLDSQISVARVWGKLGKKKKAREHYAVLRESHPAEAVMLWISESEMLREANDDQSAFDLLNKAVGLYPEDLDLRYSRALAAERLGNIALLESDLGLVLEKDPDHAHALNALGYTLADRTDRYQEALAYIKRALKLAPNDPAIIDSMGWVQYRLGNLNAALNYLRLASEGLKDGEIAAHLGEVLWASGDKESARKIWEEALREYPDSKVLQRAIQKFMP